MPPSPKPETGTPLADVDVQMIQRVIPHRYPFLLIDRVRAVVAGVSCIGIKAISFNEPVFQGHFPGKPVFPGVMIVEAMAQTSATLVGLTMDLVDKDAKTYFMGIETAKFRRMVVPGDVLELHVTVVRGGGRVWKFDGKGIVDGQVAAEATYMAMVDVPAGA
ncbi:MAG: 3-hydroxyacyl-ACP dehydratase FabZ [Gemmobacter sp.]